MVERFPSANVATTPPYWQSQNQQSQNQLAEMRAFHEQESAKMTEDMHHFRNHEVERLQAAGKELEREQVTQKASEKTPVQKEKWSLFKKKDKDTPTVISLNSASGLVQ
jgi:hypothetical protein